MQRERVSYLSIIWFQVTKCMRSLANEVAAKHDEVCHLQDQMCALDEVVQTARQKIILKDKCIAQLNQQVRCQSADWSID